MRTSQSGPGNGRRLAGLVLAFLALLAATLAWTAPVQAAGRPRPGPFGLIPSVTAAGQARSYFRMSISAGRSGRDVAIISNESNHAERLRITVSRGVTATNSGSAYVSVTGSCTGATCWVSGLPSVVRLGPGAREALPFRVRVPAGTRPAQYLAGITAESAIRPKPVRVGSNGHASARAIVIDQVTAGVAVTVGPLSALRTALSVSGVTGGWVGPTPRLYLKVANTGQTFTRATGTAACQVNGHHRSYKVIMSTVLPGGSAVLPVNARGLDSGSLPCGVRLRTSAGTLVTWSGAVELPQRVLTKTYHPSKGVYVSLPQSGTPKWAIGLMVLGGLILLALLALLIRQRRRTVRAAQAARAAHPAPAWKRSDQGRRPPRPGTAGPPRHPGNAPPFFGER